MRTLWTVEKIQQEANKYKTKGEFARYCRKAYQAATYRDILDKVCRHTPTNASFGPQPHRIKWTTDQLQKEACRHKTRKEFEDHNQYAYARACKLGILDKICQHMPKNSHIGAIPPNFKWTERKIRQEALKYNARAKFAERNSGAYCAAWKLGILDKVCRHMGKSGNSSRPEQELFNIIKRRFPIVQKLRDRDVDIARKPHIHGFDIDIFNSESRRGVEFDGQYWHSLEGLKKSHPNWPTRDLLRYHQIKDRYFITKGIPILHIKEKDWKKDRDNCIKRCLNFLGN
jgi:hypothetical protein